eukprot:TRINITY_DN11805_c0_g1_i1.p1 TRINITY_DN11805_c0_g1~~TRINITY_DN11805_c0_g1_i1.p1  ORF type:complete len:164 (+),score=6.96 TRINITY_DN11805_c0_g1_i1:518-1009(+)
MVAAEIPGLLFTMFLMRSGSWFSCSTVNNRVNLISIYELLTAACLVPFIIDNALGPAFIDKPVLVTFAALLYAFMIPIWGLVHTLTPEIYPTHLRANGVAIATFFSSIPGLVTAYLSSYILASKLLWLYPAVWSFVFVLGFSSCMLLKLGTLRGAFQQSMLES